MPSWKRCNQKKEHRENLGDIMDPQGILPEAFSPQIFTAVQQIPVGHCQRVDFCAGVIEFLPAFLKSLAGLRLLLLIFRPAAAVGGKPLIILILGGKQFFFFFQKRCFRLRKLSFGRDLLIR